MSLSPHQRGTINSISKQNVEAISETMQHSGDLFYNVGAPSLEQTHSSPEGLVDSSPEVQGVFKTDKGYQVRGNFQQSAPVKWVHQDPVQTSSWFQGLPNMNKWSQNFGSSLGVMDDPRVFNKSHEMEAMKEKLSPSSSQSYTETSQVPGADWDHHTMAAMHHAQLQALHQGHRPADIQYQPQVMHHEMPDSTLQPFQLAFGPTKQPQAPGFQQVFQGNNAALNMNYNEKSKSQQQQLLQMQQQQLQRQMQQLQQMRQLQQQQQQQQQHQQQRQMQQQQRLHQLQQQYHQHQKMQQQMHQQLQQHAQGFQHLESIEKQRVKPDIESQDPVTAQVKTDSSQTQLTVSQSQHSVSQGSDFQESGNPAEACPDVQEDQRKRQVFPRRSRRLSKDGISPQSSQTPKDKVSAQNGGDDGVQAPTVGVIQSTQRRRRASKEINLETLAQKASEMEFLPAKREDVNPSRPAGMVPLVIPVSVPVRRGQTQMEVPGSWAQPDNVRQTSGSSLPDRKPSVIVARRHSLKNSASESFIQGKGQDDKSKRRPRPEPLVIPQPCTFIAPSVYSSISAYQSNLRSPLRLPDHVSIIPPYTPPPILSPVREGSGLYFSTVLSSMAAGSQVLPPPPTPRVASRSLLRSSSSDITPPAPPLIGEATPVSLEPHINIGSKYQAEIPELLDRSLALKDQHKATLVWLPESSASQDTRLDNLMNLVCSSVMYGGGTNPELAMHCLHECRGDVMEALEMMMLKNPIFSRNHQLANYHYAGSDCWSVDEKRYFNKGISAYTKDFFMVQKLVRTKTVAQCVEFYYTYKKQARVARNGICTYGPSDPEESIPVMTARQADKENDSKQQEEMQDSVDERLQDVTKTHQHNDNERADMAQEDQQKSSVAVEESSGLMFAVQPTFKTPSPAPPKPRSDNTGRKTKPSTGNKPQGEPEGVFPCKKCSRVFYKVKSRSAHMKSHAEQEKKAAAQRQREEEERAAKARHEMILVARRKEAQGRGQDESSGAEESSAEPDDERDVDWQ